MAPLALALGMCSAACAAMAALVRADRAVEMALAPLTQPCAASSGRWAHLLERLGRNGLAARSKEFLRSRLEMAGAPWPVEAVLGSKVALSICVVVLCLRLGLL